MKPKPRKLWQGTHKGVLYRVTHHGEEKTPQGIVHEIQSEQKVAGRWTTLGTHHLVFEPTGSQFTVTVRSMDGGVHAEPTHAHRQAVDKLVEEKGHKVVAQGRQTNGYVWIIK